MTNRNSLRKRDIFKFALIPVVIAIVSSLVNIAESVLSFKASIDPKTFRLNCLELDREKVDGGLDNLLVDLMGNLDLSRYPTMINVTKAQGTLSHGKLICDFETEKIIVKPLSNELQARLRLSNFRKNKDCNANEDGFFFDFKASYNFDLFFVSIPGWIWGQRHHYRGDQNKEGFDMSSLVKIEKDSADKGIFHLGLDKNILSYDSVFVAPRSSLVLNSFFSTSILLYSF